MAISIVDRLTQAIRIAEQSSLSAQYQADYRNWREVLRIMQDARDELGKPVWQPLEGRSPPTTIVDISGDPPKLDGRTKEARALKAASQ